MKAKKYGKAGKELGRILKQMDDTEHQIEDALDQVRTFGNELAGHHEDYDALDELAFRLDAPLLEHELVSPQHRAAFKVHSHQVAEIEMVRAERRAAELATAEQLILAAYADSMDEPEHKRRVRIIVGMRKRLELQWGLTPTDELPWYKRMLLNETPAERFRRVAHAKVRADLRQAYYWDREINELPEHGDAREMRFLELMRFEHLSVIEKAIYSQNSVGVEVEDEEDSLVPPVKAWKRAVGWFVILVTTLIPMYFLLAFGLQEGKATTKVWWIAFLIAVSMSVLVMEPLKIGLVNVVLPALLKTKLRTQLYEPTDLERFPFKSPSLDSPVKYLAVKHHDSLLAARVMLDHSANKREQIVQSRHNFRASVLAETASAAHEKAEFSRASLAQLSAKDLHKVITTQQEHQLKVYDSHRIHEERSRVGLIVKLQLATLGLLVLMPDSWQDSILENLISFATLGVMFVIGIVKAIVFWRYMSSALALLLLACIAFACCWQAEHRKELRKLEDKQGREQAARKAKLKADYALKKKRQKLGKPTPAAAAAEADAAALEEENAAEVDEIMDAIQFVKAAKREQRQQRAVLETAAAEDGMSAIPVLTENEDFTATPEDDPEILDAIRQVQLKRRVPYRNE